MANGVLILSLEEKHESVVESLNSLLNEKSNGSVKTFDLSDVADLYKDNEKFKTLDQQLERAMARSRINCVVFVKSAKLNAYIASGGKCAQNKDFEEVYEAVSSLIQGETQEQDENKRILLISADCEENSAPDCLKIFETVDLSGEITDDNIQSLIARCCISRKQESESKPQQKSTKKKDEKCVMS